MSFSTPAAFIIQAQTYAESDRAAERLKNGNPPLRSLIHGSALIGSRPHLEGAVIVEVPGAER